MNFLDQWLSETGCSAIPRRVKELSSYLTIAQWCQANQRTISWQNKAGQFFPLEHAKVISLSAFLCGDPGSYKSEAVRLIGKVLGHYNDLVMSRLPPDNAPIPIFPYDKITNEYLLTCLAQQSQQLPEDQPTISTIIVDEAINFLNKRDYVEPLVGTLNSLVDQPSRYTTGTLKRQTEVIRRPIVSVILACAPGWFKHLPEAIFSGGWTGRCMFYAVPYPKDEERQPLGKVVESGGAARLAESLYYLPKGQITLSVEAIETYIKWETQFGKYKAHPLPAIDEWMKRRAIMAVRLASCIALAHGEVFVSNFHMDEANRHMEHIQATLEMVWDEIDSDDSTRFQTLLSLMRGRKFTEEELLSLAVTRMKSTSRAMQIIYYMKQSGMVVSDGSKWQLKAK